MTFSRISLFSSALTLGLGAIALTPSLASSAMLNYTFTVNIESGSLNANTYNGSFSFDDQEATEEDIFTGLQTRSLNTFNFNFEGITYDDPTLGSADFDNDNNLIGLTYSDGAGIFTFGSDFFSQDIDEAFFTYDLSDSQAGTGSITFSLQNPENTTTPEPSIILGFGLFSSLLFLKKNNK